jgi:hypothetical protein
MAEQREFREFIVALHTNENLSSLHSRADRLAELRRASREAKVELLSRIPALALTTGSAIQVTPQIDSIFPVMFVKATDSVINLLRADPIVESVEPSPIFRLASGPVQLAAPEKPRL